MLRKGRKGSHRISPEPQALAAGADGTAHSAGNLASEENLKETIEVQAQAIREMTTSLERASNLMEKQSDTFTTDMAALQTLNGKLEFRVKELETKLASEASIA